MLQPFSFIAICVPSPQSIRRLLPLYLTRSEVSQRYGRGIMPPVPNKHTSNIFTSYPEPAGKCPAGPFVFDFLQRPDSVQTLNQIFILNSLIISS